MKIVTGFRGENHITSNDDQGRNQGIFGTASYVLQVGSMFAATLASSNELQIADGEGMMQGVHFRTAPGEQNSVTIDNGTQGMKRIDLVAAHYTKNEETSVESVEWIVYKGTPAASSPAMPSYVTGDILQGATAADMPMYAVHLNGITVESVEQLFTTERGIASVLELLGNTGISSIGDGTVTGAISAINSDLTNRTGYAYQSVPKASTFGAGTFNCNVFQYYKQAVVYLNVGLPSIAASTEALMCTLPEGSRPSQKLNMVAVTQTGTPIGLLLQWYTDGRITVFPLSAVNGQFMRGTFVIPTA